LAEVIRIVPAIANEGFAARVLEKVKGHYHFVPVPRRERDVDRAPFGVDDCVELG
jgi:hypothetical protein